MTTFNLNELTSRQLQGFLPVAARHKNLLVNDVPDDLFVGSDWDLASSVVSGLLFAAVSRVRNSCIRVSAKIFGDMILLNVTDNSGYNDCGIVEGLLGTQTITEKIGTVVNMINNRNNASDLNLGRSNPAA